MAVWDLGSMENVGLWFVQKDDCVNRGTFGFTADKLVKNKNPKIELSAISAKNSATAKPATKTASPLVLDSYYRIII